MSFKLFTTNYRYCAIDKHVQSLHLVPDKLKWRGGGGGRGEVEGRKKRREGRKVVMIYIFVPDAYSDPLVFIDGAVNPPPPGKEKIEKLSTKGEGRRAQNCVMWLVGSPCGRPS